MTDIVAYIMGMQAGSGGKVNDVQIGGTTIVDATTKIANITATNLETIGITPYTVTIVTE